MTCRPKGVTRNLHKALVCVYRAHCALLTYDVGACNRLYARAYRNAQRAVAYAHASGTHTSETDKYDIRLLCTRIAYMRLHPLKIATQHDMCGGFGRWWRVYVRTLSDICYQVCGLVWLGVAWVGAELTETYTHLWRTLHRSHRSTVRSSRACGVMSALLRTYTD